MNAFVPSSIVVSKRVYSTLICFKSSPLDRSKEVGKSRKRMNSIGEIARRMQFFWQ